ncbi:MAG TPA: DNA-processing protein DprA [Candidatus Acidoferrales bacterium]|nr:DNA-processing protein DprA [Candidatus Acidoferrales bacterium]
MPSDSYLGWLALGLTPGLGARLAGKLLREFGSPEAIFAASLTSLEACHITAQTAQAIRSQQPLRIAEKELARVHELGVKLITWDDPAYPRRLREIYDPPPVLYVRGNPELLDRHSISIVGSRKPSPYGVQVAEKLGRELAARGLVVVSGMARGIDASAHRGALDGLKQSGRGATAGILGTGVDVIYPKENRKLHEEVAQHGCLVSEFPLGSFAAPQNFPIRNRVIAGMALGVVVVEGAQYSGSLITARLAMEFGREVYGVPGNVTNDGSFGPNQLIKQGAKLVTGWEDVVEELPTDIRAELFPAESVAPEERATLLEGTFSPEEKTLYGLLTVDTPRHVDALVELSGLTSSEVLASLFGLEMRGAIRQMPGKHFVKSLL